MTTAEIIVKLNQLAIKKSEDYARLDRLAELTDLLQQNHDGQRACEALLQVLERHAQVAFGTPGPLVHTLESYRGQYKKLLASLNRRPTATTTWPLNRLLNATTGAERERLVDLMHNLPKHPLADESARAAAEDFYRFQPGAR